MKRTRRIKIAERVIAIPDLVRIASILDRQVSAIQDQRVWTKHEVTFEDGTTIEGSAVEVFTEEELSRPSRPLAVEMRLYGSGAERYIRVYLHSGDLDYRSMMVISGDDDTWVNANYTALRDVLEKVAPQTLWWRRHPVLLLNLIALGDGTVFVFLSSIPVFLLELNWPTLPLLFIAPLSPNLLNQIRSLHSQIRSVLWVTAWLWRWLTGFLFAYEIRRWLLSMWPSIEFNFGSPHLRPDKRRQKLYTVLTLLVLPIIASAVYDVLKMAFN
jgi:hypothetical protein